MGSININQFVNSLNNVYADSLKAAGEKGVQNVKFSAVEGSSLQVSFVDANGKPQVVNLQMPELEKPAGELTVEDIQKCLDKITELNSSLGLSDEFKAEVDREFKTLMSSLIDAIKGNSDRFKDCRTVYDVIALLMQLMIECAQEQQKTAFLSREADLKAELGAIFSEANYALASAVAKMVTCVVGALIQGGLAIMSFRSASKFENESAATKAANGVGTANRNFQNAHLEGDQAAAVSAMEKTGADLQIQTDMKANVEQAVLGEGVDIKDCDVPKAEAELKAAEAELKTETETLEKHQAELDTLKNRLAQRQSFKNASDAIGAENQLGEKIKFSATESEIADLKTQIEAKEQVVKEQQTKVDGLKAEVESKQAALDTAKQNLGTRMEGFDTAIKNKEARIQDLKTQLNEAKSSTDPQSVEKAQKIQSDIDTANQELLELKAEKSGLNVKIKESAFNEAVKSGDQQAIDAARDDYRNAVNEGVEIFAEDCENFRAAYKLERDAPNPNAEKVEAMRKELIAKQNAFEYANSARTVAFSKQIGGAPVSTPEQIKGDIAARKMELNTASNMANADPKMDRVTDPRLKWDAAQRIVQALENAVSAGFGIFDAKGKAIEGSKVLAQMSIDADQAMLEQVRKLVEAVLQLMSVLQNSINNSRV